MKLQTTNTQLQTKPTNNTRGESKSSVKEQKPKVVYISGKQIPTQHFKQFMESQNRPKYFQNYIFNILKTKQSFFRHIYFVFYTNTFCLKHFSLLTQGSRSTVRRGSSDRCASSRILFPFSLSVYERWAKKEGGHRLKTTALPPSPPAPLLHPTHPWALSRPMESFRPIRYIHPELRVHATLRCARICFLRINIFFSIGPRFLINQS